MRQSGDVAAIDRRNCPAWCGGVGVGGAGRRSIALTRLVARSTTLSGPAAAAARLLAAVSFARCPYIRWPDLWHFHGADRTVRRG